jgi:hypothetical protein
MRNASSFETLLAGRAHRRTATLAPVALYAACGSNLDPEQTLRQGHRGPYAARLYAAGPYVAGPYAAGPPRA